VAEAVEAQTPPANPTLFMSEWEFQRMYGPWSPLRPAEVGALFAGAPFTWWVAGGWSLEEDPGSPRRRHDDIDVAVLADEVDAVREWLDGFHLWEAHQGLRPLLPGEQLRDGREQLWVRRDSYSPWLMDVLLTPRDGAEWLCKRDHRVRLPLGEVARPGPDGVPYQRPEVTLLLKAKHAREKDVGDLDAVWPRLDPGARVWFRESLALVEPGHVWLGRTGS
jgi:hypothetical protein